MATTTPNFGWAVPTSTDLVKDGATAIETLGDSIDASLVDLKGGTTGQVLSKTSNTDMDFTWVAQDDSNAIQNAIVDAKGDLITATANDTPARIAVGANNTVLTADSSTATGLKWAAAAGGANWTLLNAGGTGLSGTTTTISGISAADKIFILITGGMSGTVASAQVYLRLNGDTGNNYTFAGPTFQAYSTYLQDIVDNQYGVSQSFIPLGAMSNSAGSYGSAYGVITGCNSTGVKVIQSAGSFNPSGGVSNRADFMNALYNSSSAITSVSLTLTTGTFDRGTVYVYTSA